jgi:hypothetical protein
MTKARRRIVRTALLLQVAGIEPDLTGCNYRAMKQGLDMQLSGLTPSRRKAARRQALRLISEAGSLNAVDQLVPQPFQRKSAGREGSTQPSPNQMPRCLVCRMRFGFKRSFSSQEAARQVCERQGDPGLVVYACPAGTGFHLGHRPDTMSATASPMPATSQRQKPHRANTEMAPISPKIPHKEFPMKPEMKLTLANPFLTALYSASLLLIGYAVGAHWAHAPETALLVAAVGGVGMAAHDIALGLLWFWLTARWSHSVMRRDNP